MATRLIEMTVPTDQGDVLATLVGDALVPEPWEQRPGDGRLHARWVLDAAETGAIVDVLNDRFGRLSGFHLLILPVEAALPRREAEADTGDAETGAPAPESAAEPRAAVAGISREELHDDVVDMMRLSRVFLGMLVLSTIVATIGVLRDNVAVIIGAMVIAPLLGPNVALAFATTVADMPLLRRSLASNVVGFAIAIALTAAVGLLLTVDPSIGEIASRTHVGPADLVLGLAAGSAGVLAMTSGVPSALVGVMVAVALLPPTVVAGLMLGAGEWPRAGGALMLVAANVISINLAGVVTFLVRGVRPRTWWEADRGRRSTRIAVTIWVGLLVALLVLILAPRAGG